jgi:two-component system phosphate regulon sensor histidine kinase PhoR
MTVAAVIFALVALWLAWQLVLLTRSQRRLETNVSTATADQAARVQSLQREAETLRAVMDGMADGVWLTDADGTVIRHNDALKEMLYAGQELVGKRPLFLVRNPALHEAVEKACRAGERSQLEIALEGVRPREVAVSVFPLGGERKGSVAVFRDVTELRRLEKVRQEFVANVSHELRTPITAILGYAETLLGGALEDAAHAPQMVEVIHRQSVRLSNLVNDLLDLSRLDADELALHSAPLPLAPIVQRATEAVSQRASAKRITLKVEVTPSVAAQADERAVEQVLLNLLDNAVKYTPEGGSVSVSAGVDGSRARLCVRDTGLGIEAKHLPRLFERFYRVDRGRSRDMGGTGLGLSIVKHLVSAMGGDVQVSSQPGVGTEFSVLLPSPPRQVTES